ncbi:hypothetical protein [Marinobacterium litorale]|uniref:hypothetical protein n=1 Tax=Marinobacterium litorale TaxID=404770 RepID=UPI00041DE67C|nr:hypothetical protein [Marinobacterium litorale]
MSWLSKITGRQHHFKIELRYTPDNSNGQVNITNTFNIWMPDRAAIADDRKIKKDCSKHMIDAIPRHLKRNGKLEITRVYYLGWFKPVEK